MAIKNYVFVVIEHVPGVRHTGKLPHQTPRRRDSASADVCRFTSSPTPKGSIVLLPSTFVGSGASDAPEPTKVGEVQLARKRLATTAARFTSLSIHLAGEDALGGLHTVEKKQALEMIDLVLKRTGFESIGLVDNALAV